MIAEFFLRNTSELLAFLCFAGLGATLIRWRVAKRRDYLAAFAMFLIGTLIREAVIWQYGPIGWPSEALHYSAAGRATQIAGSVIFVRAALWESCGEWGWALVLGAAVIGAAVV